MTKTEAERRVVIARRNAKKACRGMKAQRAIELKAAVTAALAAHRNASGRNAVVWRAA